jgi:hypothetical protein
MAIRAKPEAPGLVVTSQLGLFELLEPEPHERAPENGSPALSAETRALRRMTPARSALPRLCVKPEEAAKMLSVSRDYFDENVKPELRIVRRGSRTVLIPVAELVRWVERNSARWNA